MKMNELIAAHPIGEWRFGTDVMDVFRATSIALKKNEATHEVTDRLTNGLGPIIDKLQLVFDENKFCSEIHSVLQKW